MDAFRHLQAVLVDLDGTLMDTAPDLVATVNQMRVAHGEPELPGNELRHLASYGARGMLGRGFDVTPEHASYADLRDTFIELYREKMTELSLPFPGTREAITALSDAGLRWGVVTNKYESLAVPLLEAMHFEPPPACIIGGDTASQAKPHPAPLQLACEQLGLQANRCVYVGDSDRDIEAGRAAGMYTVAAAYGYIPPDHDVAQWKADRIIHAPAELMAAVTEIDQQAD